MKAGVWWERIPLSLEEYRTGGKLSLNEKRAIKDPGDIWKIALIENILAPCQKILYNSFHHRPEAFNHYSSQEREWIKDEWYYLGAKLGYNPTSHEKEVDFESRKTHTRFRLFYALRWVENIEVSSNLEEIEEEIREAFFRRADQISYGNYINSLFGGAISPQSDARAFEHDGLYIRNLSFAAT